MTTNPKTLWLTFDEDDIDTDADIAAIANARSLSEYQYVFPVVLDADDANDICIRHKKASFVVDSTLFATACQAIALPSGIDNQASRMHSQSGGAQDRTPSDKSLENLSIWTFSLTSIMLRITNEAQGVVVSTTIPLARGASGISSRGLEFRTKGWSLAKLATLIPEGPIDFLYEQADCTLSIRNGAYSGVQHVDPIDLPVASSHPIVGESRRFDPKIMADSLHIVRRFVPRQTGDTDPKGGQHTIEFQAGHVRCGALESVIQLETTIALGIDLRIPVRYAGTLRKILPRFDAAACRLHRVGSKAVLNDGRIVCSFETAEKPFPSLEKIFARANTKAYAIPGEQFAKGVQCVGIAPSAETQIEMSISEDQDGAELSLVRLDAADINNGTTIKAKTAIRVVPALQPQENVTHLSEPICIPTKQLVRVLPIAGEDLVVLRFAEGAGVLIEGKTGFGLARVFIAHHAPLSKEAAAKRRAFRAN